MDVPVSVIEKSLLLLSRSEFGQCISFSKFLHIKVWNAQHKLEFMSFIMQCLMDPQKANEMAIYLGSVFPLLFHILTKLEEISTLHCMKSVLLMNRMHLSSVVLKRLIEELVADILPSVQQTTDNSLEPVAKRMKVISLSNEEEILVLVRSLHRHLPLEVCEVLSWTNIVDYLSSKCDGQRWLAIDCLAASLRLSRQLVNRLRQMQFSHEQIGEFLLRYADDSACGRNVRHRLFVDQSVRLESTDLSDVVSVCGVLMKKQHAAGVESHEEEKPFVITSLQTASLHRLSLFITAGLPVILEGPSSCGKTVLVHHLAHVTGNSNKLVCLHFGEHLDARSMVGGYHCTDMPGQFEWRPGCLTAAMQQGLWLLLEDIDAAPVDVFSTLISVLQQRTLVIPGEGELIVAHQNFRLIATRQTTSSGQRRHTAAMELTDKLWSRIAVPDLDSAHLKIMIETIWPQFSAISSRLIDAYDVCRQADTVRPVHSHDLFKWCNRIVPYANVHTAEGAQAIFLDSLDCFSIGWSRNDANIDLAVAIGAVLNISQSTVSAFFTERKPAFECSETQVKIGRAVLRKDSTVIATEYACLSSNFATTRQAMLLLEKLSQGVVHGENLLLVGETGTGKTSAIQYLASLMQRHLCVINMNPQMESSDLLGGYKPVNLEMAARSLIEDFEDLFNITFSHKKNAKFLQNLHTCYRQQRWADLCNVMIHCQQSALSKCANTEEAFEKWQQLGQKLHLLQAQSRHDGLLFAFAEGQLIKAAKCGHWVLLDEVNLATKEVLASLSGLLDSTKETFSLLDERGNLQVKRHPDFRLFACMNPATDVGKRNLPDGIRSRFTELFVGTLEDDADLRVLIEHYLRCLMPTPAQVEGIVRFYAAVRQQKNIADATGHQPYFSMRTLCRALQVAASGHFGSSERALYESFSLSFLTELDRQSHATIENLIRRHILDNRGGGHLSQPLPMPSTGASFVQVEGYWLPLGSRQPNKSVDYIMTKSVRANLRLLSRVISIGRFAVLLQGETSVGKTSLIKWLADATGHVCRRINNHEFTDLQEYFGSYVADEYGKLVFKEGLLVEAVRNGYWIILDELNLASADILEALNRLLDDNRELFIAETQQTIKAHPNFLLFATQNPPGLYGGRKILSRAFRNRFVELHFEEIPSDELESILHQRCHIPVSYSKKMVNVMQDLQMQRRQTGIFIGKQSYITLRDLFRWAYRYERTTEKVSDWDLELAEQGYMLLAGRLRRVEECKTILDALEKHWNRKVVPEQLFDNRWKQMQTKLADLQQLNESFRHIMWTSALKRMIVLMGQALLYDESVLLVGETGCGKTTMCQLFSAMRHQQLYALNCHMHTEPSDFLGGLRPVRDAADDGKRRLFEWCDGPLVTAMKEGAMMLFDEISLADDAVIERLNSVLEMEHMLTLSEKGSGGEGDSFELTAAAGFQLVATMNPGGDYGKKELSPALRNRFTEIWCYAATDNTELVAIIEHNIAPGIQLFSSTSSSGFGSAMVEFIAWMRNNVSGMQVPLSMRDLLCWIQFINRVTSTLVPTLAYIHGAMLVFLDLIDSSVRQETRDQCMLYLCQQVQKLTGISYTAADLLPTGLSSLEDRCEISTFYIANGQYAEAQVCSYSFVAPTTLLNAQRVIRALQLSRPVLLEGSPGVGKTTLVAALASVSRNRLVRINLSEQTDVADLFGSELPIEGKEGGYFAWRDGPLLQALKAGSWIVLDEMNLASQSVLECLNACFDHRGEVYIPELGRSFAVQHQQTKIFACQNPVSQGGARKGLPRSFLNRFTRVYCEALSSDDLLTILQCMHPQVPHSVLATMVLFNEQLYQQTVVSREWGQRGAPWEFNLRDLTRWCQLMLVNQQAGAFEPGQYVGLVYADRMRSAEDKERVIDLYCSVARVGREACHCALDYTVTDDLVQVGRAHLHREITARPPVVTSPVCLLHACLAGLESLMMCIRMNWMAILVGQSGCGKTQLVQLLAQLTGHTVRTFYLNSATDATELLGSFEQVNVWHKIERYSERVKELLEAVTAELICSSLNDDVNGILQQMTKLCAQLRTKANKVSVASRGDCLASMKSFVHRLMTRTDIAEKHVGMLRELLSAMQHVSDTLADVDSRSGVGVFDWVDSTLVKALKQGDWLLIENANFCSPSVLDRLNALLEPNGSLTIGERGAIDGQIPDIKPHPEFRLILTMDPRHGEISRPMRNRGIEIYLLHEKESGAVFDEVDEVKLLQEAGRIGVWLHGVCVEAGVHCGLHDLVALVAQCELELVYSVQHDGIVDTLATALAHSATFTGQQQQDILSVANRKLRACKNADRALVSLVSASVPDVRSLVSHYSCLSLLQQALAGFNYMWTCVALSDTDKSERFPWPVGVEMKNVRTLRYSLLAALDVLPVGVYELAEQVIQQLLESGDHATQREVRACLAVCTSSRLTATLNHPTFASRTAILDAAFAAGDCALSVSGLPCDVRWKPGVHSLLRHNPMFHLTSDQLVRLHSTNNVLFLSAYVAELRALLEHHVQTPDIVHSGQHMSLLSMSYAICQGLLDSSAEKVPIVVHLYPFFIAVNQTLTSILDSLNQVSDCLFAQLLEGLWWYERMLEVCQVRGSVDIQLATVKVYWPSLTQHLLSTLTLSYRVEADLIHASTAIQSVLNGERCSMWDTLYACSSHPPGVASREDAERLSQLRQLDDGLTGPQSRHMVLKALCDLDDAGYTDVEQQCATTSDASLTSATGIVDIALHNLCSIKMETLLLAKLSALFDTHTPSTEALKESVKRFVDFYINATSSPVHYTMSWQLVVSSSHVEYWTLADIIRSLQLRSLRMVENTPLSDAEVESSMYAGGLSKLLYDRNMLVTDVPLDQLQKRCEIMEQHNTLCWQTAMSATSISGKVRDINLRLVISELKHVLQTVVVLLPEAKRQNAYESINRFNGSSANAVSLETLFATSNVDIMVAEMVGACRHAVCDALTNIHCDDMTAAFSLAKTWTMVGLLKAQLFHPRGSVDPAYKALVEHSLYSDGVRDAKTDLAARGWHNWLVFGRQFMDTAVDLHPYTAHLHTQLARLQASVEITKQHLAYRPSFSGFMELVREVGHQMSTLASRHRVLELMEALQMTLKSEGHASASTVCQEVDTWCKSIYNWLHMINKTYQPCYRDILSDMCSAFVQMLHGVQEMSTIVRSAQRLHQLNLTQEDVAKTCRTLCLLPAGEYALQPLWLNTAQQLSAPQFLSIISRLVGISASHNVQKCSLLEMALSYACLHAGVIGRLCDGMKSVSESVFRQYLSAWHVDEECRLQQQASAESLYRFKTHSFNGSEAEDKQLYHKTFSSFERDFDDILGTVREDDHVMVPPTVDVERYVPALSPTEMGVLGRLHERLFVTYTTTPWYACTALQTRVDDRQLVPPLTRATSLLALLGSQLSLVFDNGLDVSMAELRCAVNNSLYAGNSSFTAIDKPYDFYHDANVAEAVKCVPIVRSFCSRIDALLLEFPDNPILVQVKAVGERIVKFSVSCPLMKFLHGLEVLSEKAQEWEENAHSGVSLMTELTAVRTLVVEWRSLELKGWSSCLDVIGWQMAEGCWKWWFFLYDLILGYNAEAEAESSAKLIQALQVFMECPVGEYEARWRLIHTFTLHVANLCLSDKPSKLVCVLWNIEQFYGQFVSHVRADIELGRKPLETELKEFVKIMKWNDLNTVSLRQSINKAHRTLLKFMSRYREVLATGSGNVIARCTQQSNFTSLEPVLMQTFSTDALPVSHAVEGSSTLEYLLQNTSFLSKLDTYTARAQTIFHQCTTADSINNDLTIVSEVSSDIAVKLMANVTEASKENLTVKERKFLRVRRRQILTDVFKQLRSIGFSYKKGIVVTATPEFAEQLASTQPVNMSVALAMISDADKNNAATLQAARVWPQCQKYYLQALHQRLALLKILERPTSDLGQTDIAQCCGFANHLTAVLLQQRHTVTHQLHSLLSLRSLVDKLESLPLQATLQHATLLRNECANMLECLLRWKFVYVRCCPLAEAVYASPLAADDVCVLANVTQQHALHQDVMLLLQESEDALQCLLTELRNIDTSANQLNHVIGAARERTFVVRACLEKWLHADYFNIPSLGSDGHSELVIDGQMLLHVVHRTVACIDNWLTQQSQPCDVAKTTDDLSVDHTSVLAQLDSVVKYVLLAMQSSLKTSHKHNTDEIRPVEHLSTSLVAEFEDVRIHKLVEMLSELAKECGGVWSTSHVTVLQRMTPLLHQYYELVRLHITRVVLAHRSTAELLCVLLALLLDYAQKGFGLPEPNKADADDLEDGELKQVDTGGLGDGEGAQDVSNQIETEDQLEGLKSDKPDSADDKTKPKDEKDAIEMSDDFDAALENKPIEEEDDEGENMEQPEDSEPDKAMDQVDDGNEEQLDEQLWGGDENEMPPEPSAADQAKGGQKMDEQQDNEHREEQVGPDDYDEELTAADDKDEQEDRTSSELAASDRAPAADKVDDAKSSEKLPEEGDNDAGTDDNKEDEGSGEDGKADAEENGDEETGTEHTEDLKQDDDDNMNTAQEDETNDDKEESGDTENKHDVDPEENDAEDNNENTQQQSNTTASTRDKLTTPAQQTADVGQEGATSVPDDTNALQPDASQSEEPNDITQQDTQVADDKGGAFSASLKASADTTQNQRSTFNKASADHTPGSTSESIRKNMTTIDAALNDTQQQQSKEEARGTHGQHVKDDSWNMQTIAAATPEQAQDNAPQLNVDDNKSADHDDVAEFIEVNSAMEELLAEAKQFVASHQVVTMETSEEENVKHDQLHNPLAGTARCTESVFSTPPATVQKRGGETDEQPMLVDPAELQQVSAMQVSASARATWLQCSMSTELLSRELCEQLKLILEPTLCGKFRGDYRTGKRINMKKVIAYVASQYRKDKIWLRRTKPSKRRYRVVIAVDDSASMASNQSKQMAFQSLAVVANALSMAETGELGIVSFGETVKQLHALQDSLTADAGAHVIEHFTFAQKKTKIAALLSHVTSIMKDAPQANASDSGSPASNLLLIISDGRGLYLEGSDAVKSAIRLANQRGIFLVFVIIDNPYNKESVVDIRVPVFTSATALPTLVPYMKQFPFPYYLILRDVTSLPQTLSEALRQWFDIVAHQQ